MLTKAARWIGHSRAMPTLKSFGVLCWLIESLLTNTSRRSCLRSIDSSRVLGYGWRASSMRAKAPGSVHDSRLHEWERYPVSGALLSRDGHKQSSFEGLKRFSQMVPLCRSCASSSVCVRRNLVWQERRVVL
jgi:hypothetical protein